MRRSHASRLLLRLVAERARGPLCAAVGAGPGPTSATTSCLRFLSSSRSASVADADPLDLRHRPKPSSLAALLESLGPSPASSSPSCRKGGESASLIPDVQDEEWEVVRFFPAGIAPPAATRVSAAQLGLAPRDASLLRPPQHGGGLSPMAAAAMMNGGVGGGGGGAAMGVELGGGRTGGGGGGRTAEAAWASAAAADLSHEAPSASTPPPSPSASSVLATPVATTQRATLAPRDTMAVPTVPAAAAARGREGGEEGETAADGGGGRATPSATTTAATKPSNPARSRRLILLRTEAVRAAIGAEEAWVFPCRRHADTRSALAAVRAAAEASPPPPRGCFVAASSGSPPPPPLPFELAVLEALLSETVRQFERRHRQLRLLATGVEDDIGRTLRRAGGAGDVASSSELQRLLPIARALNEMAHDVREARSAVAEVADSDRLLAAVCLSDEVEEEEGSASGGGGGAAGGKGGAGSHGARGDERGLAASPSSSLTATSEHARAAAALFESYERQLQSVEGALRELEEGLESARAVWSMTLAAQRNRIINLNLRLTVLTFSTAVACATPAAFFGMNLQSGLEEVPGMFWPVAGWSVAGAAVLGLGVHALLRWWPDASHRRRLADLKALRDLLIHHLDDLDAISAAVVQSKSGGGGGGGKIGGAAATTKLGKKEFAAAVARAGVWMLPEEIDLLFRVYDADSSGFLEVSEVIAAHNRANAR